MATTDVMQKTVTANSIYNGSIVTSCDKQGNIHVVHPDKNKAPVPEAVESILTTRFDDVDYYST